MTVRVVTMYIKQMRICKQWLHFGAVVAIELAIPPQYTN